jgi:hypothetical protein
MIEKTLKSTSGRLRVRIPDNLDELTLGQMLDLQEKPELNDLEAISILSGVPLERLHNVQNFNDLSVFGEAILDLSYQIKHLYDSDAIPKKITFPLGAGKITINVLSNLSVEPAGAFMAAREIISDEINEHIKKYGEDNWEINFNPSLKACCSVLAHYFYCKVTGNLYDEYKAEDFCGEIKKLRVTEALPIAKHFFTCYPRLSKPKTSFWLRFLQRWKKEPALNHSKSLSISTLSTPWPAAILPNGR